MAAAGIDTTYRAYTDALMITYECKPSSDAPGYNIACRAWDNALKYYTGEMEVILGE